MIGKSPEFQPERERLQSGEIPVLRVEGRNLPEVWEKSLVELWQRGVDVKTEYDRPEDPPSIDSTMILVVENPFSEPRIHRALPTGLEELEVYRQEVVEGIHDHWVGEKGWSYSYHDRLFNYEAGPEAINKIETLIQKLSETPHSRRAQAITWDPEKDAFHHEPPCLQRVWCRLLPDQEGRLVLNMNTHWRSRDALKAAFMNMFALTDLQRHISREISKKRKEEIRVGRYVDISDSYHIYGSYQREVLGFLQNLRRRSFEERTFASSFAEEFFVEARERLKDKENERAR